MWLVGRVVCTYMCTSMFVCVHMCQCVYMSVCMTIRVCLWVHVSVHLNVHVCSDHDCQVCVSHSSIPTCKIPWTEEPSGLQSMRLQRVKHDLGTKRQQIFTKIFILTIPKTRISNPFFLKLRCMCDSPHYCSTRLSARSSNC